MKSKDHLSRTRSFGGERRSETRKIDRIYRIAEDFVNGAQS
jgi:hypothetical protein